MVGLLIVEPEVSDRLDDCPGGGAVDGPLPTFLLGRVLVLNRFEKSSPPGLRFANDAPTGVGSSISLAVVLTTSVDSGSCSGVDAICSSFVSSSALLAII